jgi:hypothetical protein
LADLDVVRVDGDGRDRCGSLAVVAGEAESKKTGRLVFPVESAADGLVPVEVAVVADRTSSIG